MDLRVIAHVDMDCFFAACEIKVNPTLKGKPVVIGTYAKRGVVSTASYEARKFGIRSAMPVSEAKRRCPWAVFVAPNFELYSKESRSAMNVLRMFCTEFEQTSVDEAYMDITDFAFDCDNLGMSWKEMGQRIIDAVFDETGLTCSIGIANSRHVAKIASDFNKPNGATAVPLEEVYDFLKDMPVSKISGVGKVFSRHLSEYGINTIGDLAGTDRLELIERFGQGILFAYNIATGEDLSKVYSSYSGSKSVSRETTFQDDVLLSECFHNYATDLISEICSDLDGYSYKTVSIKVRYPNFETITRDYSLSVPCRDAGNILESVRALVSKVENRKVRLFGIKVTNLVEEKEKQECILSYIE